MGDCSENSNKTVVHSKHECSRSVLAESAKKYLPRKADCKLRFAVISDIHMTGKPLRKGFLSMGIGDIKRAANTLDALVLAGDNTDHASSKAYGALKEIFNKQQPLPQLIIAEGNHDTWNEEVEGESRFPRSKELFKEFNKVVADRDLDEVYYSETVKGYKFIVLGSEHDNTAGFLSDTQLRWLDAELSKAEENKPVFIISHWPLDNTHGLPASWPDHPGDGSFKEQCRHKVWAVIDKHKDAEIIMIDGHIHLGVGENVKNKKKNFTYSSVESYGNFHSVNLPCFMYISPNGTFLNGLGFVIEVYDKEIIVRTRNFPLGVWYKNHEYKINLRR